MEDVIHVWEVCCLINSWINITLDIQRKINTKMIYYLSANSQTKNSTSMYSYEVHRGWLN